MAIAHASTLGTSQVKASGSTLTITVGAASAGSLVVVCCGAAATGGVTVSSVTDSRGNTYTKDKEKLNGTTVGVAVFSSRITTALQASDTITITWSASTSLRRGTADAYSSVDILEVTSDGSGTSASPTTSATSASEREDTLVVGALACSHGTTAVTFTAGTGFTAVSSADNGTGGTVNRRVDHQYKIVSSAGTFVADGSYNASFDYAAVCAVYRADFVRPPAALAAASAPSPAVEITLSGTAALATASAYASYQERVRQLGAIAYWSLGDGSSLSAADSSGLTPVRDGTYSGSFGMGEQTDSYGALPNETGTCVRFGGSSGSAKNFVEIADDDDWSVTSGNILVTAWLRPASLSMPEYEGTESHVHWLGKGEPSKNEWTFRMYLLKAALQS